MRYHAKILRDSFFIRILHNHGKKTEMKIWSQWHFKDHVKSVLRVSSAHNLYNKVKVVHKPYCVKSVNIKNM